MPTFQRRNALGSCSPFGGGMLEVHDHLSEEECFRFMLTFWRRNAWGSCLPLGGGMLEVHAHLWEEECLRFMLTFGRRNAWGSCSPLRGGMLEVHAHLLEEECLRSCLCQCHDDNPGFSWEGMRRFRIYSHKRCKRFEYRTNVVYLTIIVCLLYINIIQSSFCIRLAVL